MKCCKISGEGHEKKTKCVTHKNKDVPKKGGWVGSRRSKASARGKQKINNAKQTTDQKEIITQLISSV